MIQFDWHLGQSGWNNQVVLGVLFIDRVMYTIYILIYTYPDHHLTDYRSWSTGFRLWCPWMSLWQVWDTLIRTMDCMSQIYISNNSIYIYIQIVAQYYIYIYSYIYSFDVHKLFSCCCLDQYLQNMVGKFHLSSHEFSGRWAVVTWHHPPPIRWPTLLVEFFGFKWYKPYSANAWPTDRMVVMVGV